MFTRIRSAERRVAPVEGQNHKSVMKAVYVVLEPQYQNALTQGSNGTPDAANGDLGIDLCGYLIEELPGRHQPTKISSATCPKRMCSSRR